MSLFAKFKTIAVLAISLMSFVVQKEALAYPQKIEKYKNDALNIRVYKDSDQGFYWYLAPFKLVAGENKKLKVNKIRDEDSRTTEYVFEIMFYMNDDLLKFISNEVGNVKIEDLKPLPISQIGLEFARFGSFKFTNRVNSLFYLNRPLQISIFVTDQKVKEFEKEITSKKGVIGNVFLFYDGVKEEKSICVDIKSEEIRKALQLNFSLGKLFSVTDISFASDFLISSKYIDIRRYGKIENSEIVNLLINNFFQEIPMAKDGRPTFRFVNEQKVEDIHYKEIHYIKTEESISIPIEIDLVDNVDESANIITTSYNKVLISEENNIFNPYKFKLNIKEDEQLVVTSYMYMLGYSYYKKYIPTEYGWDNKWGNPFDGLFYRVDGGDAWKKFDSSVVIPADKINKGKLEFYVDKNLIWNKLPKNFRKAGMLGLVPAIFTYNLWSPMFEIKVKSKYLY